MSNLGIRLYTGEFITCENGHPFGRVMRDCDAGKSDWMTAINWLQYTPHEGGSMLCKACGATWAFILCTKGDPSDKRGRLHVGDEWRPPLDEIDRKHWDDKEAVDHGD